MKEGMPTSKIYGTFYSPEHALSYNRHWIFSLGSRSIGKSTGVGMYMLLKFIKNGSKFIYCRRTDTETEQTCKSFFDSPIAILNRFNYNITGFKTNTKNRTTDYFIKIGDGDFVQCGKAFSIRGSDKHKSENLSEYGFILYDEFIATARSEYLGSKDDPYLEYKKCHQLYVTVDRGIDRPARNETIFFFMGNNSTYYNPIFLALGIDEYLRTDSVIVAPKGQEWLVEQTSKVEATKDINQSVGYKLANEAMRGYTYDNIAFSDSREFVERIKDPITPLCNLAYNGSKMGVYICKSRGVIYISNKTNNFTTLALTCKDQDKINHLMALRYRDDDRMLAIREAYMSGMIRFETPKIKYNISNYFMFT